MFDIEYNDDIIDEDFRIFMEDDLTKNDRKEGQAVGCLIFSNMASGDTWWDWLFDNFMRGEYA